MVRSDISDVVITLDTPQQLAAIKGKISGLAALSIRDDPRRNQGADYDHRVMQTNIREDGTFEFPAVTPGSYTLSSDFSAGVFADDPESR